MCDVNGGLIDEDNSSMNKQRKTREKSRWVPKGILVPLKVTVNSQDPSSS